MTLIKEKKIIDLRDFGLPGSPQSEECRLWACWLWVREKVEEDHDFIYRVYILRFLDYGWNMETMGFLYIIHHY